MGVVCKDPKRACVDCVFHRRTGTGVHLCSHRSIQHWDMIKGWHGEEDCKVMRANLSHCGHEGQLFEEDGYFPP